MNAIELIRSEIERRIEICEKELLPPAERIIDRYRLEGRVGAYRAILSFIDSLPESKQTLFEEIAMMPKTPIVDAESSDLEEAAKEYALLFADGSKWMDDGKYKGFIAGANWQKEQLKDKDNE